VISPSPILLALLREIAAAETEGRVWRASPGAQDIRALIEAGLVVTRAGPDRSAVRRHVCELTEAGGRHLGASV
jgi:ribosomal protein L19E